MTRSFFSCLTGHMRPAAFFGLIIAAGLIAATVVGCGGCPASSRHTQPGAGAKGPGTRSRQPGGTPDWAAPGIAALRPRYTRAIAAARTWLDARHVDPSELRGVGIKGKKKLVEQLDAYYRLWQVAPTTERSALLERNRQVTAVTQDARYHDMLTTSDRWFKQDATSYLRAALLMERMGLDTRTYREEIKKVHARLDSHMSARGPHQRRVFHWYYRHFGLREPFPLAGALRRGVIARRRDPRTLGRDGTYDLTHEVYALYEYGDRLDVDPFDAAAKRYLRKTLTVLIARQIEARDPDLTAELVECLHYLRMSSERAYVDGVVFLLDTQSADGSWGSYPRQQVRLGEYVKPGYLLHTTLVAIGALTAVFDQPMPPLLPARGTCVWPGPGPFQRAVDGGGPGEQSSGAAPAPACTTRHKLLRGG